jgi:hypothetical protein
MPRAGGEDEAEKTAPKPGEKQVEIAGVAVAAKGRESQGWMGGGGGQRLHSPSLFLLSALSVVQRALALLHQLGV